MFAGTGGLADYSLPEDGNLRGADLLRTPSPAHWPALSPPDSVKSGASAKPSPTDMVPAPGGPDTWQLPGSQQPSCPAPAGGPLSLASSDLARAETGRDAAAGGAMTATGTMKKRGRKAATKSSGPVSSEPGELASRVESGSPGADSVDRAAIPTKKRGRKSAPSSVSLGSAAELGVEESSGPATDMEIAGELAQKTEAPSDVSTGDAVAESSGGVEVSSGPVEEHGGPAPDMEIAAVLVKKRGRKSAPSSVSPGSAAELAAEESGGPVVASLKTFAGRYPPKSEAGAATWASRRSLFYEVVPPQLQTAKLQLSFWKYLNQKGAADALADQEAALEFVREGLE